MGSTLVQRIVFESVGYSAGWIALCCKELLGECRIVLGSTLMQRIVFESVG